jgi:hypothetical protein
MQTRPTPEVRAVHRGTGDVRTSALDAALTVA